MSNFWGAVQTWDTTATGLTNGHIYSHISSPSPTTQTTTLATSPILVSMEAHAALEMKILVCIFDGWKEKSKA